MQKIYLNLNFDGAAPIPGGEGTVGNVQGSDVHHLGSGDSDSQVNVMRETLTNTDKKEFPRRNIFFNGAFSKAFRCFSDEKPEMGNTKDIQDIDKKGEDLMKQAQDFAKPIKFSAVPVTRGLTQQLFALNPFLKARTALQSIPADKLRQSASKLNPVQKNRLTKITGELYASHVPVTPNLMQYLFNVWANANGSLGANQYVSSYNNAGDTVNRGTMIQGQGGNAMAQKSTDGKSIYYKGKSYTAEQLKGMQAR